MDGHMTMANTALAQRRPEKTIGVLHV